MAVDHIPSPEPTKIEALASMLMAWLKLLLTGEALAAQLSARFEARLNAIGDQISAIAARVEAGIFRRRAPGKPRTAASGAAAKPRQENPFPEEYGWLKKYCNEGIGTNGGTLLDLIKTPEMQALMAASPRVVTLFREMLFACGSLEEALPFLPQTAREQASPSGAPDRSTPLPARDRQDESHTPRDLASAAPALDPAPPATAEEIPAETPVAPSRTATPTYYPLARSTVAPSARVPDRLKFSKTASPNAPPHINFVTLS